MNLNPQSESQPEQLNRILLSEDSLVPSSGFSASVMEAIRERAVAPAPIPFPWKWAIPGIMTLIVGIAVIIRLAMTTIQNMNSTSATISTLPDWLSNPSDVDTLRGFGTQAAPAILALAGSWICVVICRRLVGGNSMR